MKRALTLRALFATGMRRLFIALVDRFQGCAETWADRVERWRR